MTKVYELPNGHRMVADIDESTRACNITETTLDSLVSKLNYYAEQTDVLDKIRAEIDSIELSGHVDGYTIFVFVRTAEQVKNMALDVIDKYKAESEG